MTVAAILPTFSADDWWYLAGRGWVATGPCPQAWDKRADPDRWMGPVLIDGRLYEVTGVESYAIFTISEGMGIGLLVREP